jgi:hypothetical protein
MKENWNRREDEGYIFHKYIIAPIPLTGGNL